MYDFLPYQLQQFASINKGNLHEMRIRKNCIVYVNVNGIFSPLIYNGEYFLADEKIIDEIICKVTENSLYNYNESLKKGYISIYGGIRIGIGGECVCNDGEIKTIKNFTSLCIRFPNDVTGCADNAYKIISYNGEVESTLIISRPGVGKTTLLKDLIKTLSRKTRMNVLVIDEKNELVTSDFEPFDTIDVISCSTKKFGFFSGIKILSPDIIIADEIVNASDVEGIRFAVNSGVKVICSLHGESIEDVYNKDFIKPALREGCFKHFILLKKENPGFCTIELDVKRSNYV